MKDQTDLQTKPKRLTRVQISRSGEETTIVRLTDEQLRLLDRLVVAGGNGLPYSTELSNLMALVVHARVVERPAPVQPTELHAPVVKVHHVQLLPYLSIERLPDLPEVEPEPEIDLGTEWRITGPDGTTATLRTFGTATAALAALTASGTEGVLTGPESAPLEAALRKLDDEFEVLISRQAMDGGDLWVTKKPVPETLKMRELLE
ncbi:MAG: hypothetical protein JNK34_01385 [Tabrizicola sp.]|nr:hypothetical protein [Tabrizicola sp.]